MNSLLGSQNPPARVKTKSQSAKADFVYLAAVLTAKVDRLAGGS
jgi:hypothetical protein